MKLAKYVYFSYNFLYIKQFNQKNGKEGEKYLKERYFSYLRTGLNVNSVFWINTSVTAIFFGFGAI